MSDDEFEIHSSKSSIKSENEEIKFDENEYNQRVGLLKRIQQQEDQEEEEQFNPEDLQELQEKINKKKERQEQQKNQREAKMSYIPRDELRFATLLHLMNLYGDVKKLQSEELLASALSGFDPIILNGMEQKIQSAKNKQEIVKYVFLNYLVTFSVRQVQKNSSIIRLTPHDYIMFLGSLFIHYGVETRVVRAFDIGFTGLENKFRVKAIRKEESNQKKKNDEEQLPQGNKVLRDFQEQIQFFSIDDDLEDLNQYMYKSSKQTAKVEQKQKEVEKAEMVKSEVIRNKKRQKTQDINEDIRYTNDYIWLEIYDGEWLTFDPISDSMLSFDKKIIQQKLHHSFSYIIMTSQDIKFKDPFFNFVYQERLFKEVYLVEVSQKYLIKYLHIRQQISLGKWFNQLVTKQKITYKGLPQLLVDQEKYISDQVKPPIKYMTEKDFRYSKHYAILSQLNQYTMLKPGAKPIGIKFKEEEIYDRSDIIILHSRDRWRGYLRDVPEGAQPIKQVPGRFDKTKIIGLYAEWQTTSLGVSLDDYGGNLPSNQYGNYESFSFPPPKGTRIFAKQGIKQLLTKNEIPFVEAVDGFDSQNSKMFAQKCGYLIFEKDYDRVTKLYDEYKIQNDIKQKENKKKELKAQWKNLFKTILTKRELQQKYQNQ